jgi:hypothetical protein
MRIIIEFDPGETPASVRPRFSPAQTPLDAAGTAISSYPAAPGYPTVSTVSLGMSSTESLRMAAMLGAQDGGPAPAAPMTATAAVPPPPFPISEPSAPSAAPGDLSAGAAPGTTEGMPIYEAGPREEE